MSSVKEKNKRTVALLIAVVIAVFGAGCSGKSDSSNGKEGWISVRINETATNDLAQVMIFTEDAEGRQKIFIRNFYKEGASEERINREMHTFMAGLEKYKNKTARIKYYKDDIGDSILVEIR